VFCNYITLIHDSSSCVEQINYEQLLLTFKNKRDSKERTVILKALITIDLINAFPAVCGTQTLLAVFRIYNSIHYHNLN